MSTSGWAERGVDGGGKQGFLSCTESHLWQHPCAWGMIFSSGTQGPGHRIEDVKWLGCLKVGVLQVRCDGRTGES